MSTDGKWLEIASELIEEFNEHAPYGFEHRRSVSFSSQLSEKRINSTRDEILMRENAHSMIKRLFKSPPYLN